MANFNLRKILVKDYGVSLVRTIDFERWAIRELGCRGTLGGDFRSNKTTKEGFLKEIEEKALTKNPNKEIRSVLEFFCDDSHQKSLIDLHVMELEKKIVCLKDELIDEKNKNARLSLLIDEERGKQSANKGIEKNVENFLLNNKRFVELAMQLNLKNKKQ